MGILRFFHSSFRYQNMNSSAMATLRRKTGYGLSYIRKALELNENDIVKAEKWLIEQAKALGWSKVAKVQDRHATQGLIGIAVDDKKVAMVEVNCETDFVSRNDKFKSLVTLVAKTCLQQPVLTSGLDTHQINYNSEEMGKLKINNSSLADQMAIFVGSVGENAILRRAVCYETSRNDVSIAVAVHPSSRFGDQTEVISGRYGAFISFQQNSDAPNDVADIAINICTHIIGTNPVKIGEYGKDEPSENVNEESVLIHQDFLLNESLTIGQLLTNSGMTILDFRRFQCGESNENETSSDSSEYRNEKKLNEMKTV